MRRLAGGEGQSSFLRVEKLMGRSFRERLLVDSEAYGKFDENLVRLLRQGEKGSTVQKSV